MLLAGNDIIEHSGSTSGSMEGAPASYVMDHYPMIIISTHEAPALISYVPFLHVFAHIINLKMLFNTYYT